MAATATTSAVLRRLRSLGEAIPGPDDVWKISRTHAGCHQRSAGAWSWSLDLKQHNGAPLELRRYDQVYGGYWPAKMCAKKGATIGEDGFGRLTLDPPEATVKDVTHAY